MKPTACAVRPVFLTKRQELRRTLRSVYKIPNTHLETLHKTPFANMYLLSPSDSWLPKFNVKDVNKIDWLQYALDGMDVRFLMCEVLRMNVGADLLGKLTEIDLEAGRWMLEMMLRQNKINAAERDTWGPYAKTQWKTFIDALQLFEAETHAVRSAIARKIACDALKELGDF